jgi:phosphoglycerate dehydrogenase-like enzyme
VTNALVTAALTPDALQQLRQEFGWNVTTAPWGAPLADADASVGDGRGLDVLVIEGERVDAAVMDSHPHLSLIACLRGNPVNVDIEPATARAIPVLHAPGRNAESVADLVLGLIYSCVRHIAHTHHLIVSGELTEEGSHVRRRRDVVWRPTDPDKPVPYHVFNGPEVSRLKLGLLGFGAVGERVAAKAHALGLRVLAHDPFVSDERIAAREAQPVAFDRLFTEADILSLHVPGQDGPPLVGARELGLLPTGAYLINTARASVLDYDALVDALADGRLAGAGLDVFPDEPLDSNSPLLDLTNVTLTPHIAGASTNVVQWNPNCCSTASGRW